MAKPNRPASEVPKCKREPLRRPDGDPVWHSVTPTRFTTLLPDATKPPIRARAERRSRDPFNVGVLDGTGSPQLPKRRGQE